MYPLLNEEIYLWVFQQVPSQKDSFSCGPLVVAIARRRLMNQPIELGDYDARELSAEVFGLIRSAWKSKILAAEHVDGTSSDEDVEELSSHTIVRGDKKRKRVTDMKDYAVI